MCAFAAASCMHKQCDNVHMTANSSVDCCRHVEAQGVFWALAGRHSIT